VRKRTCQKTTDHRPQTTDQKRVPIELSGALTRSGQSTD
jgi:hypothetical protein